MDYASIFLHNCNVINEFYRAQMVQINVEKSVSRYLDGFMHELHGKFANNIILSIITAKLIDLMN